MCLSLTSATVRRRAKGESCICSVANAGVWLVPGQSKELEEARVKKELANIKLKFTAKKAMSSYDRRKYAGAVAAVRRATLTVCARVSRSAGMCGSWCTPTCSAMSSTLGTTRRSTSFPRLRRTRSKLATWRRLCCSPATMSPSHSSLRPCGTTCTLHATLCSAWRCLRWRTSAGQSCAQRWWTTSSSWSCLANPWCARRPRCACCASCA